MLTNWTWTASPGSSFRLWLALVLLSCANGWAVLAAAESVPDAPASARQVAELTRAVATAHARGQFLAAEQEAGHLVAICQELHGTAHDRTIAAKANLAELHRLMGHYPQAELVYLEVLAALTDLEPGGTQRATILCNLGLLRCDRGDYPAAEGSLQEAAAIYTNLLGELDPKVGHVLNCLGVVKRQQGDRAEALRYFRRAQEILANAGPESPLAAHIWNNLADLYHSAGVYPEAEDCYLRGIAILRKAHGPRHPQLALAMHNLAVLDRDRGDFEQALARDTAASRMLRECCGEEHPYYALCLTTLAETHLCQGTLSEAQALTAQSREILKQTTGEQHPLFAANLRMQAELLAAEGRLDEAERELLRASAIQEGAAKRGDNLNRIRTSLFQVYSRQGKSEQALQMQTLLKAAGVTTSDVKSWETLERIEDTK